MSATELLKYTLYEKCGYSLNESKTLELFEYMHHAAFYFNDSLNIVADIVEYLFCMFNKKDFRIDLSCLKEFQLKIGDNKIFLNIIYNTNDSKFKASYSRSTINKVIFINVEINPNLKIGTLDIGLLREYLDHEVLHAVRDDNRLLNGSEGDFQAIAKKIKIDTEKFRATLSDDCNNGKVTPIFLIYRLFMETEYWALINQIPQGLKNVGSKERYNYKDDVKETFAYKEYKVMVDYIPKLEKSDDWIEDTKWYFIGFDKMSNSDFKEYFIDFCKYKLEKMWVDMSKIASGYYLNLDRKDGQHNILQKSLLHIYKETGVNLLKNPERKKEMLQRYNNTYITQPTNTIKLYALYRDNSSSAFNNVVILKIDYNKYTGRSVVDDELYYGQQI